MNMTNRDVFLMRPSILLPLPNRRELLQRYLPLGEHGGLFIEGRTEFSVGTDVDLELLFLDAGVQFHVRGKVRWRRTVGNTSAPAGLALEFGPTEGPAARAVKEFAAAITPRSMQPRLRRFPAMIAVEYKTTGEIKRTLTDDISRGGAFLLTDDLPPSGSMIRIGLQTPDAETTTELAGQVVWHRVGHRQGIGVRFIFENDVSYKQLHALVDRIAEKAPVWRGEAMGSTR